VGVSYEYGGENLIEDRYYRAISLEEARAKFAYFRDAENNINGGPAFILNLTGCGSDIGYYRHLRLGEERCRECREAHAAVAVKRYWDKRRRLKPEITTTPSKIGSDNPKERGVRNGTN